MKKVLLLMLLPAILGAANLSAQVTIGGQSAPDNFSLLDIVTTSIKKGVHLPRLTTAERNALIPATSTDSTKAKGLAVFNTTTDCYNVWSGKQWLSLCDADMNPLRITTQPAPFTWRRKQDADGDPKGPASPAAVTLTVIASGSGSLTYAWYEKPKNKNITTHGTKLGSESSYTPSIAYWGMHTYYCVVSNGTDSVVSNYADVAVGCGAKTNDGNWLSFMCYNLGADTELNPFVYYSKGDSTSFDIKGWLFQWGRRADGHQWRSSVSVLGPWDNSNSYQVPSTNTTFYGKFITASLTIYNSDWRTASNGTEWLPGGGSADPCPVGWFIPSSADFACLFGDFGPRYVRAASANANTWLPVTGGYVILPNGIDTTLFLPYTGLRRSQDGTVANVTVKGSYWLTDAVGEYSMFAKLMTPSLYTGVLAHRAHGRAIRCVKEM
jgi:uncharacterized protein (TIGR02145 family)